MQNGTLLQACGAWYVRYYEKHGAQTVRRSVHLGYVRDYPTKTSIIPVMRKAMDNVNSSTAPAVRLDGFIEAKYLPYAKELRPSTHYGYVRLYNGRLKGLPECQMRVREYRPSDVQAILGAVMAQAGQRGKVVSVRTMSHVKAFLSGVFRYSVLCGVRDMNPVRECRIPKGAAPPRTTYAYSLAEIEQMLMVLPGSLRVAVAIGGFAGLRFAEIKGLEWADYDGRDLSVNRTIWRGHVSDPKTSASKAYVPVIPKLRAVLDAHRVLCGMDSIVLLPDNDRREILRALKGTGIKWHGWHALRRGLGTNLAEMGCSDKVIQRILRHARVTVTREHYIKVRDKAVDDAMEQLGVMVGPDSPKSGLNQASVDKLSN